MGTTANVSLVADHNNTGHVVEFYDGAFIYDQVSDFIAAGLRFGQPAVVIASERHRDGILAKLADFQIDIRETIASKQFVWVDAPKALSEIMAGALPDAQAFRRCIGGVFEEIRAGREHLTVRAFGELVDLLVQQGNPAAAVRLEQLWNELGKNYGFSLLCAYSVAGFYREEHWRYFQRICDEHARLPHEKIKAIHGQRELSCGVFQNGDVCMNSGVFVTVCCGQEIVIANGLTFPDCPKHSNFPTLWKPIAA